MYIIQVICDSLRLLGFFASTLEYQVTKINVAFLIEQSIWLLYVIMSFEFSTCLNHMYGSNTCFV